MFELPREIRAACSPVYTGNTEPTLRSFTKQEVIELAKALQEAYAQKAYMQEAYTKLTRGV